MPLQHYYFSGRVQGVGFRYTTARVARQRGLTGWVKNLADGRVEAVFAGSQLAIDRCLTDLRSHFGENISDIQQRSLEGQQAYEEFEIRY